MPTAVGWIAQTLLSRSSITEREGWSVRVRAEPALCESKGPNFVYAADGRRFTLATNQRTAVLFDSAFIRFQAGSVRPKKRSRRVFTHNGIQPLHPTLSDTRIRLVGMLERLGVCDVVGYCRR
jgi:hypothetical protein